MKEINSLFLDANVFFSAIGSSTGGSAFIFELLRSEKPSFQIVSSEYVMREARLNVGRKLGERYLPALYELFSLLYKVDSCVSLTVSDIATFEPYIVRKDIPVLVSALRMDADFLITLDKKDFINTKMAKADLPLKIMLPGTYIQQYIRL